MHKPNTTHTPTKGAHKLPLLLLLYVLYACLSCPWLGIMLLLLLLYVNGNGGVFE